MEDAKDGNGGNKAMIMVQEVKIDLLLDGQKQINELLQDYFGPEGVCPKTRARIAIDHNKNAADISNIKTNIKGLWTVFTFVAVSIAGILIDIVKGAISISK